MSARKASTGLRVRSGDPLIGVVVREDGEQVTRYFTEDQRPIDQTERQRRVERAARLAGVWGDLDWDHIDAALDGIRRSTKPTPPIDEV